MRFDHSELYSESMRGAGSTLPGVWGCPHTLLSPPAICSLSKRLWYTGSKKMDQTTNVLGALSSGMADAVERASASLVTVNGRQRLPGSGVVYAKDLVVTADHVLEREEDLTVVTPD